MQPTDSGDQGVTLHAINKASALIQQYARSQNLPDLLETIVRQAVYLLKGSGGGFYLTDPEQQSVYCAVSYKTSNNYIGTTLRFGEGVAGTVAQTGEPVIIDDYRLWSGRSEIFENDPSIQAIISAPVVWQGQVSGVLEVLGYTESRRFTPADLEVLTLYTHQAAIAVENARLFEAERQRIAELEAVRQASLGLTSSLDLKEVLEAILRSTMSLLPEAAISQVFLYNKDTGSRPELIFGTSLAQTGSTGLTPDNPRPEGLTATVARSGELMVVENTRHHPLYPDGFLDWAGSVIGLPLKIGDQVVGVMNILFTQPRTFSRETLHVLQLMADHAAVAIQNARLYAQAATERQHLSLLYDINREISSSLNPDEILSRAASLTCKALGGKTSAAFFYIPESDRLSLRALYGYEAEPVDSIDQELDFRPGKGLAGWVAERREPVCIADVLQEEHWVTKAGADDDGRSAISCPILFSEQLLGVLTVLHRQPGFFNEEHLHLLKAICQTVGVALSNARHYDQLRDQTRNLESTVEQRTAELAELFALSQEIGFLYSFPDLLQRVLRHLRQAIHCDLAAVCLLLDDQQYFFVETRRKLDPAVSASLHSRCLEAAYSGIIKGQEDRFEQVQPGDYDNSLPALSRLGSVLRAPILAGKRIVGMILAADEQEGVLGSEHSRLLTTFANQASSAAARLANILTEQQHQLENLFAHLPVGVLLLDSNFRVLVANPLSREIVQALNGPAHPGEHELSRLGPYALQDLIGRADLLAPIEITLERPSRRVFNAQIRPVKPIPAIPGSLWVLMISDVTREKESQTRIQSQERLATVGQLAAGIAHDFNNIMATILVYSDLLRFDASISETSQEKLAVIQGQIQRAASLIRQILDFSRKSVIEHINLDLLPLIKELDKLLIRVLPETIHLELAYQPGSYWVSGDPTRLQQVLMNLAVNARDAMPQGGRLRFEVSMTTWLPAHLTAPSEKTPPGWVCITISDTGTGISAEIMEHLFEPFYTTKPVGQGTGLGLAQVYGIVTQHDGLIDVQTQAGVGTAFSVYLPGIQMQEKVTGPLPQQTIFNGLGRTALVVEDDATTREALMMLLKAAQCNVLSASNGIEALDQFLDAHPPIDLVVSDIVMPEMGGIGLYKALRDVSPRTRVLLITGHPLDECNQELLEEGQIHWLQKPFSIAELSQALAALH